MLFISLEGDFAGELGTGFSEKACELALKEKRGVGSRAKTRIPSG